jgi:drug/metabolite transporter (DMT)-like permease
MRARGVRLPSRPRDWLPLTVTAVFGTLLPFQLIAWGQQHIDSSTAAILMAVTPLFVLTLAHFFVPGSRLTPARVAGFVFSFAGVVFVVGPETLAGLGGDATLLGALASLGAALSYSVNSVYARRLGSVDPLQLSAGMLLASSVLCLPTGLFVAPDVGAWSFGALVSLAFLGLLSTGLATVLYFRIIQGPGPMFLSTVTYLVPAWAVLVGAVFLGETFEAGDLLGMLLILSGIALSEIGPRATVALRRSRLGNGRHERGMRAATEEA